jgi:hypothetical protein
MTLNAPGGPRHSRNSAGEKFCVISFSAPPPRVTTSLREQGDGLSLVHP